MKTHPILFSGPMIRALLAGEKTQTRRVLTSLKGFGAIAAFGPSDTPGYSWHFRRKDKAWCDLTDPQLRAALPYAPGDLLWARETWQAGMGCDGPQLTYRATPDYFDIDAWDGPDEGAGPSFNYDRCPGSDFSEWLSDVMENDGPWRPSIYMPRWASRLTLRVTDVRVQRIQDIDQTDLKAEGAPPSGTSIDEVSREYGYRDFPLSWFAQLWDTLNAKRKDEAGRRGVYAWKTNPWVLATSFEVHQGNVDAPASWKRLA